MDIAVLVKQVPKVDTLALRPDGRLERDGVELEMNAYCRRAVSKGVELVAEHGGRCVVFTLGPPSALDVLREAVAWGADEGVLVSDPAFAGSDTLATARALAQAVRGRGPFDLILAGRNSIDADTGQVGPELAELLGLPFAAGVREMAVQAGVVAVTCELDDGSRTCRVRLPAVLSVAERLTRPCKVPPDARAEADPGRLVTVAAADLGPGPWGAAASPTAVGEVRVMDVARRRMILSGDPADQVAEAVRLLGTWQAGRGRGPAPASVPTRRGAAAAAPEGPAPRIVVVVEPGRARVVRELLGEAARLAAQAGGTVTALGPAPLDPAALAGWGADQAVELVPAPGPGLVEEDVAAAVAAWIRDNRAWAGLVPGTLWGREVAGRMAARLEAGLTGDAVGFEVAGGRLVAWKPAFGGRSVAAITAASDLQLATVRPGILPVLAPRETVDPVPLSRLAVRPRGRIEVTGGERDDDAGILLAAGAVVSVGSGVPPGDYPLLEPLTRVLGAELAASRKVTDRGWQPRARQVGITGQSVQPALYVAIAVSGKFNHMVGARGAGTILAINNDPVAPVFEWADIGIVADWRAAVPLLADALLASSALDVTRSGDARPGRRPAPAATAVPLTAP